MKDIKIVNETITSLNFTHAPIFTTLEGYFHYSTNKNIKTSLSINSPLLCSLYHNQIHILSNSSGDLIYLDLHTNTYNIVSTNCGGIENIRLYNSTVVCGGWNKCISLFDNKSTIKTKNKIFHTDLMAHNFICAGEKMLWGYDLRNYEKPLFEENMNNNITSLKLVDNETYVIGSGDGKIKVNSIKGNPNQGLIFVGHKKEIDGKNYYFRIDDLISYEGRVFSCGDSRIIEWDLENKKKKQVLYNSCNKISDMCIGNEEIYFVENNLSESSIKSIKLNN